MMSTENLTIFSQILFRTGGAEGKRKWAGYYLFFMRVTEKKERRSWICDKESWSQGS